MDKPKLKWTIVEENDYHTLFVAEDRERGNYIYRYVSEIGTSLAVSPIHGSRSV